ncbi:30S ribosomal protein S5 [Candidatus Bathyarchaeota archaeon]|nr:30S ribosomal protein S5 [Candidatus Bathyarchaeota archaeon]
MRRRRSRRQTRRPPRRRNVAETWEPKTHVGKMIQEGRISSMEDVFAEGLRIRESEIVEVLLPDLQEEVININLVQKQTDAGERSRFKAEVAVGNGNGYIGLGSGKSRQVRTAIEKAATNARLNISIVRRGCGSWECGCGRPHSLLFRTRGKHGGVKVDLIPGPRGLGLVANEPAKLILRLAGIRDCWTKSFGSTRTVPSFSYAVLDALKKTHSLVTPEDWVR